MVASVCGGERDDVSSKRVKLRKTVRPVAEPEEGEARDHDPDSQLLIARPEKSGERHRAAALWAPLCVDTHPQAARRTRDSSHERPLALGRAALLRNRGELIVVGGDLPDQLSLLERIESVAQHVGRDAQRLELLGEREIDAHQTFGVCVLLQAAEDGAVEGAHPPMLGPRCRIRQCPKEFIHATEGGSGPTAFLTTRQRAAPSKFFAIHSMVPELATQESAACSLFGGSGTRG